MRLIDADELCKKIADQVNNPAIRGWLFAMINEVKNIKAESVRRGKWEYRYDETYEDYVPYCSICDTPDAISRDDYECRGGKIRDNNSTYCPNCGAKMEVENEN